MNKEKILDAIKVCSQMEVLWFNDMNPSNSFRPHVCEMRKTLGEILELPECRRKKNEVD